MGELLMATGVASLVSGLWLEVRRPTVLAEALMIGLGMVMYFCGWAALRTVG